MSDPQASPEGARRYRSKHGLWTIAYVDEERLVLVPSGLGLPVVPLALAAVLQVCGSVVAAFAGGGTHLPEPLPAWAYLSAIVPFVVVAWSASMATYGSAIRPVRRMVLTREAAPPGTGLVRAEIDGIRLESTSDRCLVHASLLNQNRLLVVLGDRIFEVSRSSSYAGGGHAKVRHDWTVERLTGGEGSRPAAPPEPGNGAWLPVIEGLRTLLRLDADREVRTQGPPMPGAAQAVLLLLAFVAAAATLGTNRWLVSGGLAATSPAVCGGLGALVGLALVVAEALVLYGTLRAMLGGVIDAFAADLRVGVRGRASRRESYRG
jgi:hypothetical protein